MDDLGWRDKLDRFKLPIGLAIVGLVLIIGGIFASGLQKTTSRQFPKESLIDGQKLISVDVSGAVKTPGVYKLKEGARIEDAIAAAAGFSAEANREYISKNLNMAQKLADGSKVYVPLLGDSSVPAGGPAVAGVNASTQININTATQAELEALPGIGPVTASKVISDRPYGAVEELLSKKVISKSVFEKIKDQVAVY
jgi:competence protein ComEA